MSNEKNGFKRKLFGYRCDEVDAYVATSSVELADLRARLSAAEEALQKSEDKCAACRADALKRGGDREAPASVGPSEDEVRSRRREWIRLGLAVARLTAYLYGACRKGARK